MKATPRSITYSDTAGASYRLPVTCDQFPQQAQLFRHGGNVLLPSTVSADVSHFQDLGWALLFAHLFCFRADSVVAAVSYCLCSSVWKMSRRNLQNGSIPFCSCGCPTPWLCGGGMPAPEVYRGAAGPYRLCQQVRPIPQHHPYLHILLILCHS